MELLGLKAHRMHDKIEHSLCRTPMHGTEDGTSALPALILSYSVETSLPLTSPKCLL